LLHRVKRLYSAQLTLAHSPKDLKCRMPIHHHP
jgi:hypothetical protein